MIRCSTDSPTKHYSITLLPGDGPEVMSVAKNVLNLTASLEGIELGFKEMPMGGVALDLTGVPLPEKTLSAAKQSDGVLLAVIGGLATVLPQLVDASTLKKEVAEGVDLMVVRELTGGLEVNRMGCRTFNFFIEGFDNGIDGI
ncbi:hypothetical protein LguiB_013354 [Lonicera macranthoides]